MRSRQGSTAKWDGKTWATVALEVPTKGEPVPSDPLSVGLTCLSATQCFTLAQYQLPSNQSRVQRLRVLGRHIMVANYLPVAVSRHSLVGQLRLGAVLRNGWGSAAPVAEIYS
jgi:hypothetical protein